MSWIVQHLLSNKTKIKETSNAQEIETSSMNPLVVDAIVTDLDDYNRGSLDPKLDNDEYSNLLLVERAIEELEAKGVLSEEDIKILDFVQDGNISFSGETDFNQTKETLVKKFDALCERVAFFMGGYFTNDGFIDYIAKEFKLTEEQTHTVRKYIENRYRHLIYKENKDNEDNG